MAAQSKKSSKETQETPVLPPEFVSDEELEAADKARKAAEEDVEVSQEAPYSHLVNEQEETTPPLTPVPTVTEQQNRAEAQAKQQNR